MQHQTLFMKCKLLILNLSVSLLLIGTLPTTLIASETESSNNTPPQDPVFARINDKTIYFSEFMDIFRGAIRFKYYHGEVPKAELIEFQKQVGSDIIKQILLRDEAIKMGLKPDLEKISKGIDEYEKKYRNDPREKAGSEAKRAKMTELLKQKDLYDQIKNKIRDVPIPNTKSVFDFYTNTPEKFTEPKRTWLSVILFSVPPSSVNEIWLDAKKMASQLKFRILEGENFEEFARELSGHPSAVNGGDLGYLHDGVLDDVAMEAVSNLKINDLSEPVRVLEGFILLRVNGIQPAKLKPFEEVKERAADLLFRQLQDDTWENYQKHLIESADIEVNEELYAASDNEK